LWLTIGQVCIDPLGTPISRLAFPELTSYAQFRLIHCGVSDAIHHGSAQVGMRILAPAIAVLGAAALTLASMIALVEGTIRAVSIDQLPLRVLAVAADLVFGTVLLLGCIYLATHLAVRIVGVGHAEFPPLPVDEYSSEVRSGDSAKI
jgi:hypothetical protein